MRAPQPKQRQGLLFSIVSIVIIGLMFELKRKENEVVRVVFFWMIMMMNHLMTNDEIRLEMNLGMMMFG